MDPSFRNLFETRLQVIESVAIEGESQLRQDPANFVESLNNNSILDLLDLAAEANIPFIDIERIGVLEDTDEDGGRLAHIVGSGLTASVFRHVVDKRVLDLGADKSIVAVKVFSPNQSSNDKPKQSASNDQDRFRTIMEEIRILRDPELAKHPNIVNLLFVGWRTGSLLPCLGLELGSYGSLEHILTVPGYSLSLLQRQNVMADVALGLHCLHCRGIYHGDLKPDNILIMRHPDPSRQLIAKVSDFGGSCRQSSDRSAPTYVTGLWLAPEVLHGDKAIDWASVDIYAYALIVASIWSRPFFPLLQKLESSCYLKLFRTSLGRGPDFYRWLLIVKTRSLDSDGSVLKLALAGTSDTGRKFVLALGPLLNPRYRERPNITTVVTDIIIPLTSNLKSRNIREEFQGVRLENSMAPQKTLSLFQSVWMLSTEFHIRSREFHEYVFSSLLNEVQRAPTVTASPSLDLPRDIPPDTTANEYLNLVLEKVELLGNLADHHTSNTSAPSVALGRMAFDLGLCYMLPIGTNRNIGEGIKWINQSAIRGFPWGIHLASGLNRLGSSQETHLHRLFVSLANIGGYALSWSLLGDHSQEHSRLLRIIDLELPSTASDFMKDVYFKRGLLSRINVAINHNNPTNSCFLRHLTRSSPDEIMEQLDRDTDASVTDNYGGGAMHYLSLFPGEQGVAWATKCYEKGARLDILAKTEYNPTGQAIKMSPLCMAVWRGQIMLTNILLQLHIDNETPIVDYSAILSVAVWFCHSSIARKLIHLKNTKPALCTDIEEFTGRSDSQGLFYVAFNPLEQHSVVRQLYHGVHADDVYFETLRLLVCSGADPTKRSNEGCPVYIALVSDDDIALKIIIDYIKNNIEDPIDYLAGISENTAIQICIVAKSPRCLEVLVREFPPLVNRKNPLSLCALHSVSHFLDKMRLSMLRLMLDNGGDVSAGSTDHITPLGMALSNCNIQAAEMIMGSLDTKELALQLGRDSNSGNSIFSHLLATWNLERPPAQLEVFKWLYAHGAAHFYGCSIKAINQTFDMPVWWDLLAEYRPSTAENQFRDLAVMSFLLDIFPDRINECHIHGIALIHTATFYGHVKIIEMLLEREADVNIEDAAGKTPLDLVVSISSTYSAPDDITRGGVNEISQWRKDMENIFQLLKRHGAQSGSGASQLEIFGGSQDSRDVLRVITMPTPIDGDFSNHQEWPEYLPNDESGPPDSSFNLINRQEGLGFHIFDQEVDLGDCANDTGVLDQKFREELKVLEAMAKLTWSLPQGWEALVTDDGRTYYADHKTKTTSWKSPLQDGQT